MIPEMELYMGIDTHFHKYWAIFSLESRMDTKSFARR